MLGLNFCLFIQLQQVHLACLLVLCAPCLFLVTLLLPVEVFQHLPIKATARFALGMFVLRVLFGFLIVFLVVLVFLDLVDATLLDGRRHHTDGLSLILEEVRVVQDITHSAFLELIQVSTQQHTVSLNAAHLFNLS